MRRSTWNLQGILVSAILAASTLYIFSKLQLAGPEGTLTRFVSAVARQDFDAASRLCVGENEIDFVSDFATVASVFLRLFASGSKYDIVDVVRYNGRARAGVVFFTPYGRDMWYIVSLRKRDRSWYIDLRRTARQYSPPSNAT